MGVVYPELPVPEIWFLIQGDRPVIEVTAWQSVDVIAQAKQHAQCIA